MGGQDSPIRSCVSRLLADTIDLNNAELHNKRVLFRVDVNVPLTADHQVADATKITSILPTLQLLLSKRARVVLCSHLGRPDQLTQSPDEMRADFSLAPVAGFLREQLGAVVFTGLTADCVGPSAARAVDALQPGQVCSKNELHAATPAQQDSQGCVCSCTQCLIELHGEADKHGCAQPQHDPGALCFNHACLGVACC